MANACDIVRYTYSVGLLIFSTIIVMALIFSEKTKISADVHPAAAFVIIWVAIIWLTMVEGGQASLVGLPPINRDLYKESHPTTHAICSIAHKGDNLNRYLLGRQFMVLVLVFTTNSCGAPLADSEVFGFPAMLTKVFLGSGIAMFLMTANIGQLAAQVNASRCMLDYINTSFMTFTLYVALGIEASGLLHSCYLFQRVFAWAAGAPIQSLEDPPTPVAAFFFWFRVAYSFAILCFAFAVTLAALFQGKTTMWETIPEAVSVILFFIFMSIVGTLEAMQIAYFAVSKMTKEERAKQRQWAMKSCDLLFKGDGRNLPGFMVGRQMCVTMCFFIIARVTTIDVDYKNGEATIFGVPDAVQGFFNTGLLGAIITTIVASIVWQLIASAFPMIFLNNPFCYFMLRWCLFLEFTGICSASWFLSILHKKVAGFQFDEVYVGTPEERAAGNKPDRNELMDVHPGNMYPGVPVMPKFQAEKMTLDEITQLQKDLQKHQLSVDNRLKDLEAQRLKLESEGNY